MKRFYGLTAVVAILIATLCLPMKPVKANAREQVNCTPAMLRGSYPFVAPATIVVSQGTVIAVPETYLYASPAPYASQGEVTFDGNSHVMLRATADRHGRLAAPVVYTGTSAVNSHCTAKVTLANRSTFTVRIIQVGNQRRIVSITPGFVLTAAQ